MQDADDTGQGIPLEKHIGGQGFLLRLKDNWIVSYIIYIKEKMSILIVNLVHFKSFDDYSFI